MATDSLYWKTRSMGESTDLSNHTKCAESGSDWTATASLRQDEPKDLSADSVQELLPRSKSWQEWEL